jgi:hypothetical protein
MLSDYEKKRAERQEEIQQYFKQLAIPSLTSSSLSPKKKKKKKKRPEQTTLQQRSSPRLYGSSVNYSLNDDWIDRAIEKKKKKKKEKKGLSKEAPCVSFSLKKKTVCPHCNRLYTIDKDGLLHTHIPCGKVSVR